MPSTFWLAVGASVLSGGVATGLGALPAMFLRSMSERLHRALSGFAGGVMLAATFFSLIVPGLEHAGELLGSEPAAVGLGLAGLFAGAAAVALANRYAPHEHFLKGREGPVSTTLARTWLFVLAITLHNFPEGLAVGVGVGSGESALGLALTTGIALQNAPEGFVVAMALVAEGYSRPRAIFIAFMTGMVEPVGAALGAGSLALGAAVLPFALFFAAGAMLFVISDEVIPESHRGKSAAAATWATLGGYGRMMALDVALG